MSNLSLIKVIKQIVEGNFSIASDIDVLLVSSNILKDIQERSFYQTKIKSSIDSFSSFKIHLVTLEKFKNWWKIFIKDKYIEIN